MNFFKSTRFSDYGPLGAIVAGSLVLLFAIGIRSGFGLFLQPISDDFGWGRGVFAFAIALQNLIWGVSQPFVGAMSDKYGSGRTIAIGGLCYAVGLTLMSGIETPLVLNISAGLLIGFGLSGTSFAVVLAAMTRDVSEEKRSLVLGVGSAAGSAGQVVMILPAQLFLSSFSWSTALLFFAVCSMLMVPAAALLTGRSVPGPQGSTQVNFSLREALNEAFAHRGYLYLIAGFFVCGFHVTFVATHLPAYLVDNGIAADYGAWALSLIGLFNIIGSFAAGVLGGRYSKKYCLSFLYFSRGLLFIAFILVPLTPVSVLIFASVLGLLWLATVPLTSGLVAQIFGPQYLATLFGVVFLSHQIGSFLGVWLGGYFYDATGSYIIVWWISVALSVFSGILHWPINERSLRAVPA